MGNCQIRFLAPYKGNHSKGSPQQTQAFDQLVFSIVSTNLLVLNTEHICQTYHLAKITHADRNMVASCFQFFYYGIKKENMRGVIQIYPNSGLLMAHDEICANMQYMNYSCKYITILIF